MAKPTTNILSLVLSITISISISSVSSQLSVSPILTACPGLFPKSSKITVYVLDRLSGDNQTVYPVAQSSISPTSPSDFGVIYVADDKVTVGPDYYSHEVGRAQGTPTTADLSVLALDMNLNFYFTTGIYNGSTISILGRNPVLQQTRVLSVVGGSGIFRCARGFVILNTYSRDSMNGDASYDFYVDY